MNIICSSNYNIYTINTKDSQPIRGDLLDFVSDWVTGQSQPGKAYERHRKDACGQYVT